MFTLSNLLHGSPDIPEPPPAPRPGEPAPIAVHRLDFTALGLPKYANKYAIVIDNLFTPEDCKRILAEAEVVEWEAALLNGGDEQYLDTSYRHSSRILHDDQKLADLILAKMRPYLQDIETTKIVKAWHIPKPTSNVGKMTRLNERLRFLRYGPGQFFKPHCDSSYATPDQDEVSYYTLQLYLNGDRQSLEGGATRFWTSRNPKKEEREGKKAYIDVEPRLGRVLVFQQSGLLHSGEEVKRGIKITVRTDFMYSVAEEEDVMEE